MKGHGVSWMNAASGRLPAPLLAAPALALGLTLAAASHACTAVAPQVELCTEGTFWDGIRAQDYAGVRAWDGHAIFLEFSPEMSAAAPEGALSAAMDGLLAVIMAEEAAADVEPVTLQRDRFETAGAISERQVMQIEEEGETYIGALLLTEIAGGPRVAWSLVSFEEMELDALLALIEATAGGLRLSGGS